MIPSGRPRGQPIHLRPTAPLAPRVLLPGDPGRALALAQTLLSKPVMFTIQATGIGGPSAAIVLWELIALGARRAIRVGTCGALAPSLQLGDVIVAREAICLDGTSRALAVGERIAANSTLTEALMRSAPAARAGPIASIDLFYDNRSRTELDASRAAGGIPALAVEMEAATLFALGARAEVAVACMLAVSDTFDARGARTRIDDHALLRTSERMGAAAVAALSA